MGEPLRSVPTSTTNPHVQVVDLDFSFEDTWRETIWRKVAELGDSLDTNFKGYYVANIDRGVKGWIAGSYTGDDGYLLVRTRVTHTRRLQSPTPAVCM